MGSKETENVEKETQISEWKSKPEKSNVPRGALRSRMGYFSSLLGRRCWLGSGLSLKKFNLFV
jgi:hypothetical protein